MRCGAHDGAIQPAVRAAGQRVHRERVDLRV
jgi:hypothetical protein